MDSSTAFTCKHHVYTSLSPLRETCLIKSISNTPTWARQGSFRIRAPTGRSCSLIRQLATASGNAESDEGKRHLLRSIGRPTETHPPARRWMDNRILVLPRPLLLVRTKSSVPLSHVLHSYTAQGYGNPSFAFRACLVTQAASWPSGNGRAQSGPQDSRGLRCGTFN